MYEAINISYYFTLCFELSRTMSEKVLCQIIIIVLSGWVYKNVEVCNFGGFTKILRCSIF